MNKAVGIGIGLVAIAIAAVFAFSYSAPENLTQEDSISLQDEATTNVEVGATEPGNKISLRVEEKLGVEDKTP